MFSLDVMITGAHSIIYSTDAEADRKFLRDVLPVAAASPALCCKFSMMRTLISKVLGGLSLSR